MAPLPAVPTRDAVVDFALRMASEEPALTSFTVPRQALVLPSSRSAGGLDGDLLLGGIGAQNEYW